MMTVRQLLNREYPTWDSTPLLRAAVCTRLLRAGYNLDEDVPPTSLQAAQAIIKRSRRKPPPLRKVTTTHTASLGAPLVVGATTNVTCRVCHQPTIIAKLATGDDAYYCETCKAVIGTIRQLSL